MIKKQSINMRRNQSGLSEVTGGNYSCGRLNNPFKRINKHIVHFESPDSPAKTFKTS